MQGGAQIQMWSGGSQMRTATDLGTREGDCDVVEGLQLSEAAVRLLMA